MTKERFVDLLVSAELPLRLYVSYPIYDYKGFTGIMYTKRGWVALEDSFIESHKLSDIYESESDYRKELD